MTRDLDDLQGSWVVTTLEVDGEKIHTDLTANARIVIKGKRFTSTGMGAVYEGTLELNASKTPAQIDMKFDTGPEKGNINRGIYALDGDTWKICLATRGNARPSRFATRAASGFALETLARAGTAVPAAKVAQQTKKAAPSIPRSAIATEFEGEWKMVSGTMDGKPLDESVVQWVKRVTHGNETTVYAGPQVMLKVEFTSDSSTAPKNIDYLNTAGANKGKAQHGIYEFERGLLKICVSAPGKARPGEFKSQAGDGTTLTVWKRA